MMEGVGGKIDDGEIGFEEPVTVSPPAPGDGLTMDNDERDFEDPAAVSPTVSVDGPAIGDGERALEDSATALSAMKKSYIGVINENWCEICNIRIREGESSLMNHNAGKAHLKKVFGQQLLIKLSQEHFCFDHNIESGVFRCRICNVEINSPQLLESHLNGAKHKKQMKLEDIPPANGNAPAAGVTPVAVDSGKVVTVLPVAAASTADTEVVNDDNWCEICKCRLQGKATPALVAAHMESAKHKKKLIHFELIVQLRQEEEFFEQDPVSGMFRCTLCNLEMPAPQQLKIHFYGTKHKNKAERITATAETGDKEEGEVSTDGYWCLVCKLSGPHTPQSVASHKSGAKHLRKVAASELLEKLKETTNCFDYFEETGILKCKLCKTDSNTPQHFEIHLNGSKHKMMVEGGRPPVKRKHDGNHNNGKPAKRLAHNNSGNAVAWNYPKERKQTSSLPWNNRRRNPVNPSFNNYAEEQPMYAPDYRSEERWNPNQSRIPEESWNQQQSTQPEEKWYTNQSRIPEERWNHNQSRIPEEEWNYNQNIRGTYMNDEEIMTNEEIENLSAPHGEIKDVSNLMKKWSSAYYRHQT